MSASRTLGRRRTKDRVELADGQMVFADRKVTRRRLAPGAPFRRVTTIDDAPAGVEHTYHATKGHRWIRTSA